MRHAVVAPAAAEPSSLAHGSPRIFARLGRRIEHPSGRGRLGRAAAASRGSRGRVGSSARSALPRSARPRRSTGIPGASRPGQRRGVPRRRTRDVWRARRRTRRRTGAPASPGVGGGASADGFPDGDVSVAFAGGRVASAAGCSRQPRWWVQRRYARFCASRRRWRAYARQPPWTAGESGRGRRGTPSRSRANLRTARRISFRCPTWQLGAWTCAPRSIWRDSCVCRCVVVAARCSRVSLRSRGWSWALPRTGSAPLRVANRDRETLRADQGVERTHHDPERPQASSRARVHGCHSRLGDDLWDCPSVRGCVQCAISTRTVPGSSQSRKSGGLVQARIVASERPDPPAQARTRANARLSSRTVNG